jgi:hypothetical protein
MATSIAFTDGTGAATLTNGLTAPADRFGNWTPDIALIGPSEVATGTGVTSMWAFRTDYVVSFELDKLPASTQAVALRLKAHLLGGGTCTVTTGDTGGNTYTCRLRPGTSPTITFSDRKRLRYTLALELKNTSAAPLLCEYSL